MLHWWLIPVLVFIGLILWGFYLVVRTKGGPGIRTDGRTLVDRPEDETPPFE